jgi:two-component system chemotaxis sensor kinase CheA
VNPLLNQFIQESREGLQGIGEKLIALEDDPGSVELMTELFRLVHTLKGNSGLFDFPEMTRVLHAGEDLMDAVRDGRVAYSQALADRLLDAMDFVGLLLDEIETEEKIDAGHAAPSAQLVQLLRALIGMVMHEEKIEAATEVTHAPLDLKALLAPIPESARLKAFHHAASNLPLFLITYRPEAESFFKGEDPFYQVRQTPNLIWGSVHAIDPWPALAEIDCYRCQLEFQLLVALTRAELDELYRYMPEQIHIQAISMLDLIIPQGHPNGGPVYGDFVAEAIALLNDGDIENLEAAARTMLELSAPELWLCSALRWLLAVIETSPSRLDALRLLIESLNTLTGPDWSELTPAATSQAVTPFVTDAEVKTGKPQGKQLSEADLTRLEFILATQAEILTLCDKMAWMPGRIKAIAATLTACLADIGKTSDELDEALQDALFENNARPLRQWLEGFRADMGRKSPTEDPALSPVKPEATTTPAATATPDTEQKFGRRNEDVQTSKVLKVDQVKIDRLMDLIGEMVVAKNSLPYLANRAEDHFGVRELSREIKSQYAVINRIAEEMQDAIMQVRMTPVSFVFQRFPRMVRDISRKLGKEVELVLEGEDTEADKNIIEALADPLIHIVRNSLDHGLEMPEVREKNGKARTGKLTIRARQESDRVLIEIIDDGRGIDPEVIKRKAYEKGVIDEATLSRISDQDAINLVFAAGFSTAEAISDLSGRGVGMDVVRSAIDRVGGAVALTSIKGTGTTLQLSLPLSMAVTNVMIIESDKQIFGVPMDLVVETVRLPSASIQTIKKQKTTVLRGRIVPLIALNDLMAVDAEPILNDENEVATLVVRVGNEQVGLLVDNFNGVVDVILKPLPGELSKIHSYAGSALMGDGSVLLVLNPKELF